MPCIFGIFVRWKLCTVQRLLAKLKTTGTTKRKTGSGRPISASTDENVCSRCRRFDSITGGFSQLSCAITENHKGSWNFKINWVKNSEEDPAQCFKALWKTPKSQMQLAFDGRKEARSLPNESARINGLVRGWCSKTRKTSHKGAL